MAKYWNILDNGYEGDFLEDATSILQEGIDSQPIHGLPVYIPCDIYISDTIVVPRRNGGKIITVGRGHTGNDTRYGNSATKIEWYNEDGLGRDKAMFKIKSSNFRWEGGAMLMSNAFREANVSAGYGIVLTNDGEGYPVKNNYFECIYFDNNDHGLDPFKVSIRFGEPGLTNLNITNNTFKFLSVIGQDSAIEVYGNGPNTIFAHFILNGIEPIFHIYGQSNICCRSMVNSGTLFEYDHLEGKDFNHHEFSTCYVKMWKADATNEGRVRIIQMNDPANLNVVVEQIHNSFQTFGSVGGCLAYLKGGASVSIRDAFNMQAPNVVGKEITRHKKTFTPNVYIQRSRTSYENGQPIGSGESVITNRHNGGYFFPTPIQDFSRNLADKKIVHNTDINNFTRPKFSQG